MVWLAGPFSPGQTTQRPRGVTVEKESEPRGWCRFPRGLSERVPTLVRVLYLMRGEKEVEV
jgi:hypothetical protein